MRSFSLLGLALLATSASGRTIIISAGDDFEASCLHVVAPGDTCYLEKGDYYHDGLTRFHGSEDSRITITGDPEACIRGSNTQDRVLQIAHDYYTIEGICFDGQHGDDDYVSTAIYVLGADKKSTKNGVTSSVTGLQMFDLEIKNFASECVHFRYFVTHAEVTGCTVEHCGIDAFADGNGSKVGQGICVGTALDQVEDGKAPDNVSADVCASNWIHHNTIRTYGNECVEMKEGSSNNLVEHNVCEQQKDPNSGCFSSRGSDNTFRWNEIAECVGAGVRVGGDEGYGEGNHIYGNSITNVDNGAFSVMAPNQGTVCENSISGVYPISVGDFDGQNQFLEENATGDCSSYPGDIPEPTPDGPDYVSLGCYGDGPGPRIMVFETTSSTMTAEVCSALCDGSTYFGTQYSSECWCGDEDTDFDLYGSAVCYMACTGDDTEICGGSYAMSVYEYTV